MRRSAVHSGGYLTDYPMVRDTLLQMKAKLHVELAALFDMIQLYEKVTAGEGTPARSRIESFKYCHDEKRNGIRSDSLRS